MRTEARIKLIPAVGDHVYYHPVIGEPHTGVVHEVRAVDPIMYGGVCWLVGKSGFVSCEAISKAPAPPPRLELRYTDPSHLSRIHHLDGDSPGDSIEVVGDPDNASYEWVVRRGDELKHSDVGYGQSSIALRDALVDYYGDVPIINPSFTRTRKAPR